MVKIGILGTDNSHSIAFSQTVNDPKAKPRVPGAKVVAVFGLDDKRNKEVAEKGLIPTIVKKPADMLPLVDAVIVDFRHGGLHYKYAKPFVEAGIPTFVDKPFTVSLARAKKLIELAKKKRTPMTSFSTVRLGPTIDKLKKDVLAIGRLRGAVLTGPGSTKSEYHGIFFYAVHVVEMMLEVFGTKVASVSASDCDGSFLGTVKYSSNLLVSLNVFDGGYPLFACSAYGLKGEAHYDQSNIFGGYYYGMKEILKMVKTGKPTVPHNDMLLTVKVLTALQKSLDSGGKEIKIK